MYVVYWSVASLLSFGFGLLFAEFVGGLPMGLGWWFGCCWCYCGLLLGCLLLFDCLLLLVLVVCVDGVVAGFVSVCVVVRRLALGLCVMFDFDLDDVYCVVNSVGLRTSLFSCWWLRYSVLNCRGWYVVSWCLCC